MGESRSDLLAWINELLQLNVAKIESLGSGAVYCQILDSIYGDVPLQKVQFQAKQEYQYLSNFKVLQDQFKRHRIDKPIPVEGLIRCKMQDNLEFTQWIKKFWDAEWPGEEYDAVGRRGGAGGGRGATPSSMSSSSARPSATTRAAPSSASTARRAPAASTSTAGARRPVGSAGSTGARAGPSSRAAPAAAASNAAIQELTREMSEMRVSVEALEKERDFYFGKLREIEIIVAARLEEPEEGVEEGDILKSIQEILYQTEEGFEIPDEEGPLADEEETF